MKRPHIILEFANNHMGDLDLYDSMIADYVDIKNQFPRFDFSIKLQYRDLDTFIHKDYKFSDHQGVRRFETTRLDEAGRNHALGTAVDAGFAVGCTPFDEVSVREVINDNRISYLKIGSCSFNDWPLLEAIKAEQTKKDRRLNIIASTGGASVETIDSTVSFLTKIPGVSLSLMHCNAEYPSDPSNANLAWISYLTRRYHVRVGYSTHEAGDNVVSGSFAFCAGANIFEKHVVGASAAEVNKYSSTPEQVVRWLENLELAMSYFGSVSARPERFVIEQTHLSNFQRGVYVNNPIGEGDKIDDQSVYFAFPKSDKQLPANSWSKFLSVKSLRAIKADAPVLIPTIEMTDMRKPARLVLEKIQSMIRDNEILVPSNAQLEISHHYGMDKFDEFGMCMITLFNVAYCKKLMFVLAGQRHPQQYHKIKQETFTILAGEISLTIDGEETIKSTGDIITIEPGQIHEFQGIRDSIIEEVSSTHHAADSFYVDESINLNPNRKSIISLYNEG